MESKSKDKSKIKKNDLKEAEFEGDTTEDAITAAEQSLGLDREHMEIKVVCEEEKGLFGMRGAKRATIKVLYKRST